MDNSTFYLGSANMDWRSSQVKELGILIEGSFCLSRDLLQIFDLYWEMGVLEALPVSEREVSITAALFIPECNDVVRTQVVTVSNMTEWPFTFHEFFENKKDRKASCHSFLVWCSLAAEELPATL